MNFRYDLKSIDRFIKKEEFELLVPRLKNALSQLKDRTGAGSDFLGWVNLPTSTDFTADVEKVALEIRENADTLVVIGIGGSYLGARAVISALGEPECPEIIFAGKNISGLELENLLKKLESRNFYLNVISKSGTTTEPAIAFRMLLSLAQKKYGADFHKRVIATTDASRGALRKTSEKYGFRTFVIPDDIGGRFSVLTPVGLLPVACAGIDIRRILKGALSSMKFCLTPDFDKNPSMQYAAVRHLLYQKGFRLEIMSSFEPALYYLVEWWKQLYGESEGKDQKGIFPAGCVFSTDLHSLGQFIQDGSRFLFETFLVVEKTSALAVTAADDDSDGLNYLSGKTLDEINYKAYQGTMEAHLEGNVPVSSLLIPSLTPEMLGELIYFFETGIGITGYLLGVNPFDQPGVEAYKKNMFRLLGKK